MTERFFEERQDQSEAKARIISKYFSAWARVIMPSAQRNGGKIAYIDLYAGPGRYKDGAASTPLLVLQTAINHPQMAQMLVSYFNDVEINNTSGVRLTEESDVGFPHPVAHASLAHAYRNILHGFAGRS